MKLTAQAWGLLTLAVIVLLTGASLLIHHDGEVKGEARVQAQWQAARDAEHRDQVAAIKDAGLNETQLATSDDAIRATAQAEADKFNKDVAHETAGTTGAPLDVAAVERLLRLAGER